MKKLIVNFIILALIIILPKFGFAEVKSFATNGLLIFLDDSEMDDGEYEFGAISNDLLSALVLEEAGPIIASASLLVNIRSAKKPKETDPQKLFEFLNRLSQMKYEDISREDRKEEKSAILSIVSFNKEAAKKWVIKEINSSLYLLIPKKYLKSKGIKEIDVEAFSAKSQISSTEQALGLKVNHMKTVTVNNIKRTSIEPKYADYFVNSLHKIFVINKEYPKGKNIPTWAIYINGHGFIKEMVAHMSIDQFRAFLTFLEKKIRTKLLYYLSCYAAGLTSEIIYEDAESDIDKTYPFAIITQALTDAPTDVILITFDLEHGKLKPKISGGYNNFFNTISSSDIIDYKSLATPLVKKFKEEPLAGGWPQIRFPGLPWFSIVDTSKVVSIGSVLAKARKAPLDISTFFARLGKKAEPLGILLYTEKIPFELIINSTVPPAIISMIPGNAVHNIEKISSNVHTVIDILDCFLIIWQLYPRKIFIINQLQAPFTEAMAKMFNSTKDILSNVVIDLTEHEDNIYFTYKGNAYKAILKEDGTNEIIAADEQSKGKYEKIIDQFLKKSEFSFDAVQAKAQKMFAQKISSEQAKENITELLDLMPDNTILRIPKILGQECPPEDIICWWNMLVDLANYSAFGGDKILWIDKIQVCGEDLCLISQRDIIIDTAKDIVDIFYKDHDGKNPQLINKNIYDSLTEDYIPIYEKIFDYFKKHKTIDETLENELKNIEKRSVHELLTPETIAKIQKSIIAGRTSVKKEQKISDIDNLIELTLSLQAMQAIF